jgi:hypothetical protein
MNVASLDKCKELYELSRWDDTTYTWYGSPHPERDDFELGPTGAHMDCIEYPAYDLGYLLRRLPQFLVNPISGTKSRLELSPTGYESLNTTTWCAVYADIDGDCLPEAGFEDIPEDAAAKLAVELFKQGILTKQ